MRTLDALDFEHKLRQRGHDVWVDEDPTGTFNVYTHSCWPLWISWLWKWM